MSVCKHKKALDEERSAYTQLQYKQSLNWQKIIVLLFSCLTGLRICRSKCRQKLVKLTLLLQRSVRRLLSV